MSAVEFDTELDQLRMAIGLLTTLKGDLVMNPNNPMEMAKEIHAYVTRQLASAKALTDVVVRENGRLETHRRALFEELRGFAIDNVRLKCDLAEFKPTPAATEAD